MQTDTSLLLASKEVLDANSTLELTIRDMELLLNSSIAESQTGPVQLQECDVPTAIVLMHLHVNDESREIDLPGAGLTDEDALQLKPFGSLSSLLFGDNRLTDVSVEMFTLSLTGLSKLQLNSNAFSSDGMRHIKNLHRLQSLDIRNNNLGDGCMLHLAQMSSLQELSLSKNNITDLGAVHLQSLPNLVYLDITNNCLTEHSSQYLVTLAKLNHLYLMSNRLALPAVLHLITHLIALEVLDVRFNLTANSDKDQAKLTKPPKLQLFC